MTMRPVARSTATTDHVARAGWVAMARLATASAIGRIVLPSVGFMRGPLCEEKIRSE
jgi:hypothetical protein